MEGFGQGILAMLNVWTSNAGRGNRLVLRCRKRGMHLYWDHSRPALRAIYSSLRQRGSLLSARSYLGGWFIFKAFSARHKLVTASRHLYSSESAESTISPPSWVETALNHVLLDISFTIMHHIKYHHSPPQCFL